jgi:hypothetical protein
MVLQLQYNASRKLITTIIVADMGTLDNENNYGNDRPLFDG